MAASRDPTARLRAGLNPLLTASLGIYPNGINAHNTPLSAVSVASHGAFSSAQTPISAIQPYNPQEWIASPVVGPGQDRMPQMQPPQSYGEPQGMLALIWCRPHCPLTKLKDLRSPLPPTHLHEVSDRQAWSSNRVRCPMWPLPRLDRRRRLRRGRILSNRLQTRLFLLPLADGVPPVKDDLAFHR